MFPARCPIGAKKTPLGSGDREVKVVRAALLTHALSAARGEESAEIAEDIGIWRLVAESEDISAHGEATGGRRCRQLSQDVQMGRCPAYLFASRVRTSAPTGEFQNYRAWSENLRIPLIAHW